MRLRFSRRHWKPNAACALTGVLLSTTLFCPASLASQSLRPTRINSEPACPECRIEANLVATLTGLDATSSEILMFTQDSRGNIYGVDWRTEAWAIKVFDRHGRFVKTLGRRGDGPGEFRFIRPPLFSRGDTAIVIDMGGRRLTYLSPSGSYLSSHRLAGVREPSSLVILDSGFVAAGTLPTGSGGRWPLHYLTRTAQPVRSFGSDVPLPNRRKPDDAVRVIALAPPLGVWSAFMNRYVIEKWTIDGKKLRVLERDARWFVPWDTYEGPFTVVRPPNFLHAIWEDEQGRLWVVMHVPDSNWRRINHRAKPGDEVRISRADKTRVFDTLVEVIDPVNGRLLTSRRFPDMMTTDAAGHPFATYHEDSVGNPSYRLWRFSLNSRR